MQRRCVLASAVMYGKGDIRHTGTRYRASNRGAGNLHADAGSQVVMPERRPASIIAPTGAGGHQVHHAWTWAMVRKAHLLPSFHRLSYPWTLDASQPIIQTPLEACVRAMPRDTVIPAASIKPHRPETSAPRAPASRAETESSQRETASMSCTGALDPVLVGQVVRR